MKIALDAMGGDFAPKSPVAGAVAALRDFPDISVILVGDEQKIRAELAQHDSSGLMDRVSFHAASQVVDMTDSGLDSVRRKKDSSISRAIDLVKAGEADAVVSAGHTGALVAAATIKLRTLPGIERAGLAVFIPAEGGVFLLIDGGANIDPAPEHIVGFAVMGSIYMRELLGIEDPKVGLLNIGSEPGKGNDFSQTCHQLLATAPIHFAGNVEGHGIFKRPVDIVVCDGFTGNIVLKTIEGLAKSVFSWLGAELKASPIRLLGALLAKGAFQAIRNRTNTEEYGGTPLLGVNGICIKAHGNSSPRAMRNAIRVARAAVQQKVNTRIVEAIRPIHEDVSSPQGAAA
ncbi:MAG: phosphate acyltransferase PlsX [Terrimicrobiaceae bacterium]|nr:phosphate acyltransferase PlsX [Terrimicrobiaceae bacterium]